MDGLEKRILYRKTENVLGLTNGEIVYRVLFPRLLCRKPIRSPPLSGGYGPGW